MSRPGGCLGAADGPVQGGASPKAVPAEVRAVPAVPAVIAASSDS